MSAVDTSRLTGFLATHGGSGSAVIMPVGRLGVRLVVVAADGRYADAVLPTGAAAELLAAELKTPVVTWDRELTGRVVIGPEDRRRMAGSGR